MKMHHPQPWHVALGLIFTYALFQHHGGETPAQPGEPVKAWISLLLIAASVALSLAAGYLMAEKNDALLKDDKPTTLVKRGAFMNWIIGVRRVGPLFAWAGDRGSSKESSGKKGGGGAPEVKIWHESGWHLLCVGPAHTLYRILNNGKAVFEGPINRNSHSSGTFVDLGSEGGFYIYWGEEDQPVNTFLGDSDRVGIESRWPYHCYVLWVDKRLGQSAHWPLLDYEIEKRIENSNLTLSDPDLPITLTLDGPLEPVDDVDTTGATDFFVLEGTQTAFFYADGTCRLTGNALSDRDLVILYSDTFKQLVGAEYVIFTRVHFTSGTLAGADDTGNLQAYTQNPDYGINGAHAIDAILHAPWPTGLGFPTSGPFQAFDLDSLEELGVLLNVSGEALRTSWISLGGENVSSVLGAGLQDLGVLIPENIENGLIKFVPVREPSGTIPRIRDSLVVDDLPEVETWHFERPTDRLTFSFPDRVLVDRDATIAVMDDGQVSYFETQHARNAQITITTDFGTASKIAQRRSQEGLAGGGVTRLKTNRGTRDLQPGQAVIVDALDEILRVSTVHRQTNSNVVTLELIADYYGVALSPFIDTAPPITGILLPVLPDLAKTILEVPEYHLIAEPQTVIIPRLRAHNQTYAVNLYISRDDVTYTMEGQELDYMAGGTLNAALPAPNSGGSGADEGGLALYEDGPQFTALGPDIGTVLDLSSDLTNWRLGRQIAVVSSSAGTEICFLRNISIVAGDVWELEGLLRARWDTEALDHPAGAEVFIFLIDEPMAIQDILLEPAQVLYAKTQPLASGALPLDADAPVFTTLYGKGKIGRPVFPAALSVTAPDLTNAYQTGDSVSFRWCYGTPQSPANGAGLQGAGVALGADPAPDEDFRIEFRNAAGTLLQRTAFQTANTYTYSNAQIITDMGAELSFQIWVYQRRGGLLSDPVKMLVEKI